MVESAVESSSKLVVGLTEKIMIRVLHVDDDAGFLKVAQQCLRMQEAFEVETALSVEEAMAKMKKKTFDVIVSDYQMPEKSGLEFLKELRGSGNNVPFILFTGKGREEVVIKALNLGADQYLNKFGAPETVYGELAHGIRKSVEVRKAETALQESEERFRSIVENSHDGILMIDNKFMITYTNDEASHIIGYSKEEMVGHSFMKFLSEESKNLVKDRYLRRQKGERVTSTYEFKVVRKDGQKRDVEIKATVMRDSRGMMQTVAQLLDITERKKAEEAVKESEQKLRGVIATSPDGVAWIDTTGKITLVNRKLLEVTGFSKKDIVGKNFMDVEALTQESKERIMENFRKRIEGIDTPPYEVELITKNEEIVPAELSASLIYEGDKIVGTQAILRDITERKRAEEMLSESQDKFERMFMGNPEAAVYVDSSFHVLDVNPRFESLFGYSLDEVKGKYIKDLVVPEDKMEEAAMLDKESRKGYVYRDTVRKRKDGTLISVSISAAPIITKAGSISSVAIYKDISQLKSAEKAVREMMMKLAEVNEKLHVVGRLTRHDVRNKLSLVTANVYLAKQRLTGDNETLQYLSDIESAVCQTVRILDFAGIYEKLGMEELGWVHVEKSVEEAATLFPELNLKVANDCSGLTVLADSLLRQLFYNLIHNSSTHGEKVSQIRVYYKEVGKDQLKLVYEDDGVGIPDAEKDKIFREGYGRGTGYGLYLVRKMCEVYSWTIRETGKPGEGARFTITIPKMNESGKESYRI